MNQPNPNNIYKYRLNNEMRINYETKGLSLLGPLINFAYIDFENEREGMTDFQIKCEWIQMNPNERDKLINHQIDKYGHLW
jgi:hypothetical protein